MTDPDSPILFEPNNSLWQYFEQSPDAMIVHVHRRIVKANASALRLMGTQHLYELQNRSLLSFVTPEYRQIADNRIQQVIEGRQVVPILEEKLYRLNGTILTAELYSIPVLFEGEVGAMTVVRDVTESRRMETKLEAAKDEAIAASQAKTFFLTKMSHELRTPLHGVMGMLELLFESTPTPLQLEYLGLAYNSTQALLSVVSDLLDISSIEAGQISLGELLFDVEQMLRTLVQTLRPKAQNKGLFIEFHYAAPHLIKGDPTRLWQIFANLLNNAIKFTERGGIRMAVGSNRASAKEVHLLFAIADTGIGIPESEHTNIFEPFYQVETREDHYYEGTGLGLAICKQLVSLMDGRLSVESRLGVGSTFSVHLKFPRPTQEEVHHHLRNGQWWWPNTDLPKRFWPITEHPDEFPTQPRRRILVVEDNLVNQKLMCSMLQAYPYQVDLAENGKMAVERAHHTAYDLILMDVQMPVLDGLEATKAIRNDSKGASQATPIVAVTAYAMPSDRDRCLQAGMDGYLSKPVQRHSLEEILNHWLLNKSAPGTSQPS